MYTNSFRERKPVKYIENMNSVWMEQFCNFLSLILLFCLFVCLFFFKRTMSRVQSLQQITLHLHFIIFNEINITASGFFSVIAFKLKLTYKDHCFSWLSCAGQIKFHSVKLMIRFLLGKEKPSEMRPVLNLWLRSSVVSFVQLVSGRHVFESHQSLNFFTLLVCN